MKEVGNIWAKATALNVDELGAVLKAIGGNGDGRSRLEAVVALFANNLASGSQCHAGAFAGGATEKMTDPFTSGLHNCLRGGAVNDSAQPQAPQCV